MVKNFCRFSGLKLIAAGVVLTLAVIAAGCSEKVDQAELDLLLNEDPAFAELVRAKSTLESQVSALQNDLAARKRDMEQKIETMRQTYNADRGGKEQKINEYRSLIKTQKDDFTAGYDKVNAQLDARKQMRADIERAVREAQGVVAKKDKLAITGKEIGEWEARIENLQNRLGPLDAEISALESQASIKRKKLKYL